MTVPLYEFECRKCAHIAEVYHSLLRSQNLTTCEECGGTAVKIISAPNVQSDTPAWIDQNLRNMIQDDEEPPIETRTQLKKAEEEKGIVENPKK